MKTLLFTSLLLSVTTCQSKIQSPVAVQDSSLTKVNDATSLAGKWELMPVMASDTAAGKIPNLDFDLKANRFNGNTGCNAMSGTFMIKQDALQFNENIISTKMACQGYNEKAFLDNLLKTNRYTIENGVLQLMFNTTVLSKWVRHADSAITKQI